MLANRQRETAFLRQNYRNDLDQNEIDRAVKAGMMFSFTSRYESSDIFSLTTRLVGNTSISIDKTVDNYMRNGIGQIKCLSGMYGLPAKYFGSIGKIYLEGFCFHGSNIRPLIFSKADIWSFGRAIKHKNATLITFSFEDLYFKVSDYSFAKMRSNREIANLRRLGKIKECTSRENSKKAVDPSLKTAHYSLLFHPGPMVKKYSSITGRYPKALPHNECLALVNKPCAILSVYKTDETVEPEFSAISHKWVNGIYECLIDLRDLQRQKSYYYLTGDLLPIVRTTSTDNFPKIVTPNETDALKKMFFYLNDYSIEKEEFSKLLVDKKFYTFYPNIAADLANFYIELDLTALKNPELLLLWSLDMGFKETTSFLLSKGVALNLDMAKKLTLLDGILEKRHLEEAFFLLRQGLSPESPGLLYDTLEKFDGVSFKRDSNLEEYMQIIPPSYSAKL